MATNNEEDTKEKRSSTSDLLQCVMDKLDRIDDRLQSIETQQTLTEAAWRRQGSLLEEVNKRCMEKLGLRCPLIDNREEGESGDDLSNLVRKIEE